MANSVNVKRIALTLAKTAGVFFVLAIAAFFVFRNTLLRKAIDKATSRVQRKYDATLQIGDAAFSGISSVNLGSISLVPQGRDTLLQIGEVKTSVKLWYALFLDFRLNELEVSNGYVSLVKDSAGTNIDAFIGRKDTLAAKNQPGDADAAPRNLARSGYKLISKILNFIPSDVRLNNVSVRLDDGGQQIVFGMDQLLLVDGQLDSRIRVWGDSRTQQWVVNGQANPQKKMADVRFYSQDTGKVLIPYINRKFNVVAGFDTIRLKLDGVELDDDELHIRGLASTRNFLVNHPKISSKDVVIGNAEFDYHFVVGSSSVAIDSSSLVTFNRISFRPFVRYERSAEDTIYQLNVMLDKTLAQDFILSLPEGLFTHFKGMEAEGSFSYRLDFLYSQNNPRDLVFESRLEKDGLRILKYGEANLSKLNTEFTYVPIERGRPMRPIEVGASNPNFVPLDQISPLLKKSVLTTEDPSFFYHRGFIDEAFRQSIIKNIRKRGFVRGASTISMQLVKNVFLTREKTLSRKLEEILLVYILENNRLSSKERMFEVYLNIIEWGPNVYGIGEAARFYFNKSASELTLSESLFLSIIIPSPKKFMWRFGKDGQLKDHVGRHFHSLAGLMIRRDVLMQEDTMGLTHHINISGPAKGFIKITADTLVSDTILMDENGLLQGEDE